MRIIDKNTDFYDYLSYEYPDKSISFDRTDSFTLSKQIVCENLNYRSGYLSDSKYKFLLLQACNTFWLFLLEITEYSKDPWSPEEPVDYIVTLLSKWKNYDKQRRLLSLDGISFKLEISRMVRDDNYRLHEFDKKKILDNISVLVRAVDQNDYEVESSMNSHTTRRDDNVYTEKHIPLLKASGLAALIDPLDIYLSIEEFFSLNKQDGERTESVGITDKEKIVNHGFDTKRSFRGKGKKK